MLARRIYIDEYGNELGQWRVFLNGREDLLPPYENCIAEDCYNQGWHARNAIAIDESIAACEQDSREIAGRE